MLFCEFCSGLIYQTKLFRDNFIFSNYRINVGYIYSGYLLIFTVFAISASVSAENWPQYEGTLHQNSSTSTIAGSLTFKWEKRFTGRPLASDSWPETGYASRNIVIYNNKLAIAASNDTTPTNYKNYVTILSCYDGSVLNSITTNQQRGPGRPQFSGAGSNWMEAYDTGMGFSVLGWDPATEILFMANGGDAPGRTGYKVLSNMSPVTHAGTAAWGDIATAYPNLQDRDGRTRANPATVPGGETTLPSDNWDRAANSNDTAFFDISLDGNFVVDAGGSNHLGCVGNHLVNKYTGLRAYREASGPADVIEPPVYSPALQWGATRTFKMWGGVIADGNKMYYIGPSQDINADRDFGESSTSTDIPVPSNQKVDQGLYIVGCNVSYADSRANDGYTGTGIQETANLSVSFVKRHDSPYVNLTSTPAHPANCEDHESYLEIDGFYRNKALLAQGSGVWVAWKPAKSAGVQLIRATASENNTYDLSVGKNRRGQDIWPNISYVSTGGNEYIVYYAANAYYMATNGSTAWTGVETTPLGPSELAVFDVTQRKLKWVYELNNTALSGNYPSLQPNEAMGYFERSRMAAAGNTAYLAWIDSSTVNLTLRIAGFDIIASTPASAPVPFSYDLGVLSASNNRSCVMDLITADGKLYVLITESNVLDTQTHGWTAQRIVCAGGNVVAPAPTYLVSGTIKDGSNNGISAVTVQLGGLASGSRATPASGEFSFSALSSGTYVITPRKTNWVFTPQSSTFTLTADITNQNFVGVYTGTITLCSFSGYVKNSSSQGVNGVSINVTGNENTGTTTDISGLYAFTNLSTGTYTLAPAKTGSTFNPVYTIINLTGNQTVSDIFEVFIASAPVYSLSGYVKDSNNIAISNVALVLTGSSNGSTTTDSAGCYLITNLSNGNYTITPSKTGYVFNPVNIELTINADSRAGQNFTGTVQVPAVSNVRLENNKLNPGKEKTSIICSINKSGKLTINIYTLNGQLVKTVIDEDVSAGTLTKYWDGTNLGNQVVSSGIYLININGPGINETKKVGVIK
ncbi:MAG: hypothetical protein A2252_00410 [Elusimicrobia bacterium RIFOXYA2_FULL_39_19]|nr:MAG: hypothetical protein A2252_00410 [Elusimicrobia bacterium RIFOXYA2_FULL_39_19]